VSASRLCDVNEGSGGCRADYGSSCVKGDVVVMSACCDTGDTREYENEEC
jgi:hypothetical protein